MEPTEPFNDAEIEDCIAAAVERGEFATVVEARVALLASLDHAIAQAEAGDLHDIEVVRASLHERFTQRPYAAE